MTLPVDLSRPAEVERMVAAVLDRFGHIDVFLANAGLYVPGDVTDGDPDAWEAMIAVNLSSVFRAIRAVLPGMIERRSGHIIVTSSISGHAALHWEPVYSATKHGIQTFVHGLRRQVAPYNIRIGEVSPGIVLNELWGYTDPAVIESQGRRPRGPPLRGHRRGRGLHADPPGARHRARSRHPAAEPGHLTMLRNALDLPKTMAAVICHAPEDYRLEELPVPEVGPGEVLVKVAVRRHLRQRPQVLPRRAALLGRRAPRAATASRRSPPVTSSSARWWRSARAPARSTASTSATWRSPSRSCPAGSAASA